MSMLRSIREKKGLTLGQLAARASISAKTLTDYEEGRQPIPLSHAKVIAKALWVQIEDLMPPAGSVPPAPRPTPPAPAASGAVYTGQQATAPQQRESVPGMNGPQAPNVGSDQPSASPANRHQPEPAHRPYAEGAGGGRDLSPVGVPTRSSMPARRGPDVRAKSTRPAAPPRQVSEGQIEELMRLAARLELDEAALEARTGKPVAAMMRNEAKDWIKKLRETANETAPGGRVHYGQWPGSREDEEASYLRRQRDAGNVLAFRLFSGEQFTGTISEFTPYTITIRVQPDNNEMVLRKLAIVYYRQTEEHNDASAAAAGEVAHSHPSEETGISSDRVGEPVTPEVDRMDKDRGV